MKENNNMEIEIFLCITRLDYKIMFAKIALKSAVCSCKQFGSLNVINQSDRIGIRTPAGFVSNPVHISTHC